MHSPKAYSHPFSEAVYADLFTIIAAIQKYAKYNRYALFKRDTKPARVVFVCDQYVYA